MKQLNSCLKFMALIFFIGTPLATIAEDTAKSANSSDEVKAGELSATTKRALDHSAAEVVAKENGDLLLKLNGSHQHVYMARVGADGKIETFCAADERSVRSWLFKPASDNAQ